MAVMILVRYTFSSETLLLTNTASVNSSSKISNQSSKMLPIKHIPIFGYSIIRWLYNNLFQPMLISAIIIIT